MIVRGAIPLTITIGDDRNRLVENSKKLGM